MSMEQKTKQNFEEKFIKLVSDNNLTINSIEDLLLEELEEYKRKLELQLEDLLAKEIDEKELIHKKNKNGKKKDLN